MDTAERRRRLLLALGASAAAGTVGTMLLIWRALEKMYLSVQLLPPTARQLRDEDFDANALFRAVPQLRGKLAWRQLGSFPTPVHQFELAEASAAASSSFWVKREDLAGSAYGGNKVRTLQFQLAACEAQLEKAKDHKFLVMGTGGSNQIIATKLYAAEVGMPAESVMGIAMLDLKEMDNTLNYMSSLSLPGQQASFNDGLPLLKGILAQGSADAPWIFAPGGNGPAGVLGQVGGALELAEQIASGEVPDPDAIVVAVGSQCTITGLVLGVALARAVGLDAFQRPNFRIHGMPIHPAIVMAQKYFGVMKSESFPLSVGRGVREAAAIIARHGGPDVTAAALRVMADELDMSTDSAICGKYGAHSKVSKEAKALYDASVKAPPGAPDLWLCGHFTAKSFALMLQLMKADSARKKKFLFWQTKSIVQPLGPEDEWTLFEAERKTNKALGKYAVVGGVTGHPSGDDLDGKYTAVTSPDEYRKFMTPVLRKSAL